MLLDRHSGRSPGSGKIADPAVALEIWWRDAVEPPAPSPPPKTGTSYWEGGLMGIKTCLAGLCLAVLAATVVDVPPVEAQTYTAQPDRPVNRPRARITVEPRSFLDAGTEVLPGERKFTDYA